MHLVIKTKMMITLRKLTMRLNNDPLVALYKIKSVGSILRFCEGRNRLSNLTITQLPS